jgi:LPS sulfotransferase NodH
MQTTWRPRLSRWIRRRGLLDGQSAYSRFIILGRSRTGSNYLRGLLNSHPQVVVFGELFRNYEQVDWAYPGYVQTPRMMADMRRDPVAFLQHEVYSRFPEETAAVGFKIFYYHAHEHGWDRLWPHLEADKALRVLHIKRRNMLKTHVSRARAAQTEVWTDTSGLKVSSGPLVLDYEECLADFERTLSWEGEFDARFADHPLLEIIYEDLVQNNHQVTREVQTFLDVPYCPLQPETFRQSSEPLAQAIANYAELKERFAGSRWEVFFEG